MYHPTKQTIKKLLKTATKQLHEIRKNAVEIRKEFLHELRERIAQRKMSSKLPLEKAIKEIDKQLRCNGTYTRIRKLITPNIYQSLLKVEIIKESIHLDPNSGKTIYIDPITNQSVQDPTVITIDTKEELEKAILQRNKRHFAQAKNTPWNQEPLNYIGEHNGYNLFKTSDDKDIQLPPDAFIETKTMLEIL